MFCRLVLGIVSYLGFVSYVSFAVSFFFAFFCFLSYTVHEYFRLVLVYLSLCLSHHLPLSYCTVLAWLGLTRLWFRLYCLLLRIRFGLLLPCFCPCLSLCCCISLLFVVCISPPQKISVFSCLPSLLFCSFSFLSLSLPRFFFFVFVVLILLLLFIFFSLSSIVFILRRDKTHNPLDRTVPLPADEPLPLCLTVGRPAAIWVLWLGRWGRRTSPRRMRLRCCCHALA